MTIFVTQSEIRQAALLAEILGQNDEDQVLCRSECLTCHHVTECSHGDAVYCVADAIEASEEARLLFEASWSQISDELTELTAGGDLFAEFLAGPLMGLTVDLEVAAALYDGWLPKGFRRSNRA